MDPQETAGAAASRTARSDATATDSAAANGMGAVGLRLPPRRPGPLASYVSEPPSTLAMMKMFAQELLLQQDQERDEQQQQQTAQQPAASMQGLPPAPLRLQRSSGGSGGIPAARSGGSTPHGAAFNLDLPPLGVRQLGPRRHCTTPAEATPLLKRNLRTSIGWVHSPSDYEERIIEHRVAGDLIMPAATVKAINNASGMSSPAKDALRRRNLLRHSEGSGVPPSPCKAATAGGGGGGGPLGRAASPLKKPTPPAGRTDDDKDDDMESLDYEGRSKAWYRKKSVWLIVGPLFISFAFTLAGILYLVLGESQKLGAFQAWRVLFWIAGLPIIWLIGRGVMKLAVWGVERTMFTYHNALYFCYAVRKPMANVLRAAMTTGWWALMMTAFSSDLDSTLLKWYNIVLKLLGCLTLFMTANLLKVLFAKMMSSKFNQASHYAKMQEALKREHLLHLLLQPRQRFTEMEELEEEEDEEEGGENQEGCKGDESGDMTRSHSAPGELGERPTLLQRLKTSIAPSMFASSSSSSKGNKRRGKPTSSRTFKETVLFWRGSQKDLHSIEEAAEERVEAQEQEQQRHRKFSLPPHAVAVDMGGGSNSMEHEHVGAAEAPLLDHHSSPHPLPIKVPAAPPSDSAAGSPPASPPVRLPGGAGARAGPAAAASTGASPLGTPRRSSHHGTPIGRRLSGESEGGLRQRSVGLASKEASVAGGRAFVQGTQPPAGVPCPGLNRAASLQSHRSVRDPLFKPKPLLSRAASLGGASSSGSQKHIMALKMSKMEQYIRKNALQVTFKDELSRTERSELVTTELEAKKLGFYLFHNIKTNFDRQYIVLEDLEEFLTEPQAAAAWDMLDDNKDGQVNVQECCVAIAKVFVDRRNLAASLKDARSIVGKLETVIGIILHIIMGFLYLVIFDVDVMKTWAGFASLFIGLSFVFGNSIRTTYENVVFLFLVHPYDIGEMLFLDNDHQKVEEIHLSFTVLMNSTNGRVWYPNEKIRVLPFVNLATSGNKGESFKVLVDLATPSTVTDSLRAAAELVIKANPTEFNGTLAVGLNSGTDPLKMTVYVYWQYSHSGADVGRIGRARTKMYAALSAAMGEAGARYSWPAMGGHGGGEPPLTATAGNAAGLDFAPKLL